MNTLRPFFALLGRPAVFWLSVLGLFVLLLIVAGLAQPDDRLNPYVHASLLAALLFPAVAGRLAGAVVQEFQHTTFAAMLPGVRFRIASGFLAAGLVVTVFVVAFIALASSTPQNLPLLFVLGLGAYCFGGMVFDPLSNWITTLNGFVALVLIVSSREIARLTGDHPSITLAVCLGVGICALFRLFARSTFRRIPFRPVVPVLGSFSLEKAHQRERRRRIADGPKKTGWRAGYLGNNPWSWARAAFYERHGARGWKATARSISRTWGLALLVVIYAWVDKGEMSFGAALAKSIHDALLRSPYQPEFGEKGGPYLMVAIVIATVGILTALFAAVTLSDALTYPLSRRKRAQVLFRGGLVEAAMFLFVLAPCLLVAGQLAGWFVGYEIRFDFMPFFFRVLLITLVLIPLAHWGRLRLQMATRRRSGYTHVGVIFGIIGFVIAVCSWTFLSPLLFGSPLAELGILAVALLVSQLAYRRKLTSFYRTADLT